MISFCRSSFAQAAKDVVTLELIPKNSLPSSCTDFLTARLLYTPVRLLGSGSPLALGRTPLHTVVDWAKCLLASNAANSTFCYMTAQTVKAMTTDYLVNINAQVISKRGTSILPVRSLAR